MRLPRRGGEPTHHRFDDLPSMLRAGDLLVLNDTRVIPARLLGHKPSGGRVELLLVEPIEGERLRWTCMLRASRPPRVGTIVDLGQGLSARIEEVFGGQCDVRFDSPGDTPALLEERGRMPLPPYIRRESESGDLADRERYQTVYARRPGAVAAPTAGLHFTEKLLGTLEEAGVGTAALTLHVGPGTFRPLRVENVEDHTMHEEWFEVPEALSDAVSRTRAGGGRVVAVGTTALRVLEHRTDAEGRLAAGSGMCGLFIYPGYRFRGVDALITNFHLPRSSLLLLVAALVGRERLLAAYRTAIAEGYRFYSYGDAMFIGDDP